MWSIGARPFFPPMKLMSWLLLLSMSGWLAMAEALAPAEPALAGSAWQLAADSVADTADYAHSEDYAHSDSVAPPGSRFCGSAWQLAADSVAPPGSLAADYAHSEDYAPTSPAGPASIPQDAASIVQDAAAEGIEV